VVATIVTGIFDLKEGMILIWATLVLFALPFITVGVPGMTWILPGKGLLIYAAFTLVTFGFISGKPLYPCSMHGRWWTQNSGKTRFFIRVNVLMTGVWGESLQSTSSCGSSPSLSR
jgi:hypothetical protein